MREKLEFEEGDEESLGDSLALLKDGRPVWAEVLDNQRGYANYSDFWNERFVIQASMATSPEIIRPQNLEKLARCRREF